MLTGEQIRATRESLGWSRAELSRRRLLPLAVVEVVEDYGSTSMLLPGQMAAIVRAFESAGVEYMTDADGGSGVRLREEAP